MSYTYVNNTFTYTNILCGCVIFRIEQLNTGREKKVINNKIFKQGYVNEFLWNNKILQCNDSQYSKFVEYLFF